MSDIEPAASFDPDDIDESIFMVQIKVGRDSYYVGIDFYAVLAISPDITAPKTKSTVYATVFPDGICVEGRSIELIQRWSEQSIKMVTSELEDEQTWAEAAEEV